MKKILSCILLILICSNTFALTIKDVQVSETADEIKAKKNKFLCIKEKDLIQYEKIIRKIEKDSLTGVKTSEEIKELKTAFESYLARRLNMIRKGFFLFRKEFNRIITHINSVPAERIPAFKTLLKVLAKSVDKSKFKGSKEKYQILQKKVQELVKRIDADLENEYKDNLVLTADNIARSVFEAKIALLHRWLLENRYIETKPWITKLDKKYIDDPYYLALKSHVTLVEYKLFAPKVNFEELLEKQLKKKFGNGAAVSISVKTSSALDKAYLYYVEALKRGYPSEKEIPGLLPAIWDRIEKRFEKIYPYWSYPTHVNNYRKYMTELANHCKTVIQDVPFRKYANKAYKILENIYRYWPSNAGPKLLEYNEIMKYNRLVAKKKF